MVSVSRHRPVVAIPGKVVRCQWGQFGMRASPYAPPNIEWLVYKSWMKLLLYTLGRMYYTSHFITLLIMGPYVRINDNALVSFHNLYVRRPHAFNREGVANWYCIHFSIFHSRNRCVCITIVLVSKKHSQCSVRNTQFCVRVRQLLFCILVHKIIFCTLVCKNRTSCPQKFPFPLFWRQKVPYTTRSKVANSAFCRGGSLFSLVT